MTESTTPHGALSEPHAAVRAVSAPEASDAPQLFVLFKVDGTEYALPASLVTQMETFEGASHVPGAAPFVLGVLPIRGRVVPVVDLRLRFGLATATRTQDSRVVVGQLGERTVALLADSAREVVSLRPSQLRPPPRLVDEVPGSYVQAVAQVGTRLVMVLDFAKVIGEESNDG
jgi:purine-binding chemotaxis protein CheW